MKNKKILVTGADGFIGSHLCEKLLELGANITALSTYNSFGNIGWLSEINNIKERKINIIPGDITDEEQNDSDGPASDGTEDADGDLSEEQNSWMLRRTPMPQPVK